MEACVAGHCSEATFETGSKMGAVHLTLDSLVHFIHSQVGESTSNRLTLIDGSAIFEQPLVGIADGDDPIFEDYKSIIGLHHQMPREVLAANGFTATEHTPVRVVSWILPIAKRTRESNARMTSEPSQRWTHTRHYGEIFNDELRRAVQQRVRDAGAVAVSPAVSDGFRVVRGVSGGPTSTWSERHAAYAAGLGTFGLCDGFLTPVGKAMRCGSVVVAIDLPVSVRRFKSHMAACPYMVDGSCGECMQRCPAGAIGAHGHDKLKCDAFQDGPLRPLRERYGVAITGCGLCQTGVPCESGLPDIESRLPC